MFAGMYKYMYTGVATSEKVPSDIRAKRRAVWS